MKATQNAKLIINVLENEGHQAYFVGGCVRDFLMGRESNDFDITTSAKPDEIENALEKNQIKFIETGLKHGTITAVIDDEQFEITTFRTDGDYRDSRHPESVSFVTEIYDDLARRDFTINAIAYNDAEGIVDKFNGLSDIKNRIIKTVGNPETRFNEDALRIIRALRFSSTLNFEIEKETSKAIHKNAHLLQSISQERIFNELIKLLLGKNCERVLLEYKDVIGVIIPEIRDTFFCVQNTKWHLYDVYTHSVKSISYCPFNHYIRLTLLLHDIGKPFCKTTDENNQDHFYGHPQKSVEIAKVVLKRLKVSNELFKKVITLIEIHDKKISINDESIKFWLRTLGEELFFDLMQVKLADMYSHNLEFAGESLVLIQKIKQRATEIIANNEPYRISDLKINGNDLVDLGFIGADIKNELEKLIVEVSKDPTLNTKTKLISIAKKDR